MILFHIFGMDEARVSNLVPIKDELLCRCTAFIIVKCMSSENSVVRTVAQHGVYFRHMLSPIGSNVILCCNFFGVCLSHIGLINKRFVWRLHEKRILVPQMNKINVIKELLNVKHNSASVSVLDLADIVFFVLSRCVWNSHFTFTLLFTYCTLMYLDVRFL